MSRARCAAMPQSPASPPGRLAIVLRCVGKWGGVRLEIGLIAAAGLFALNGWNPAWGQKPAPQATAQDYGLVISRQGAVRQGDGRRVLVQNAAGSEVVALLHVDVGDRRLVILPNGRLSSFPISETKATQQPFVPATRDQLAAELGQTFADFHTRTNPQSRYVYVYNASDDFWKATSRILESMYNPVLAYFRSHKFAVHDPATPLVVVMFRTEDEFQKYQKMPPGVVAYYNPVSNYVVMYEQSKLVEVAPDLAVRQSIATIAHEGIHQILHNIGIQQRLARWPLWTAEGVAEYFAPTSCDKRLRWKGVGVINDLRMYELEQYFTSGQGQPGELLSTTIASQKMGSLGYASSWALTHYLARMHKDKFFAYLAEVSKLEPFAEDGLGLRRGPDNKELFVKYFGSDYATLENELIKYLKKQPYTNPLENQTHYVVMLSMPSQRTAGVTSSPTAVTEWEQQTLATVPANLRAAATFMVRPFSNRAEAEQFAKQWLHSR